MCNDNHVRYFPAYGAYCDGTPWVTLIVLGGLGALGFIVALAYAVGG